MDLDRRHIMKQRYNCQFRLGILSIILLSFSNIYGVCPNEKSQDTYEIEQDLSATSTENTPNIQLENPIEAAENIDQERINADIETGEVGASVLAPEFHVSNDPAENKILSICRFKSIIFPILLTCAIISGIVLYDQIHKPLDDPDHIKIGSCARQQNNGAIEVISENIFDGKSALNIHLFMNPWDWKSLKNDNSDGPGHDESHNSYDWFPVNYNVNGIEIKDGKVKKKSWLGSYSREKPGLKLKNDAYDVDSELDYTSNPLAKFSKFTLNNSIQDKSYIRQCVAYEVFRRLGTYAPECQFVHVCVNKKAMGIYVAVEPLTNSFFDRTIQHHEITLYEGDITGAKGRERPWVGSDFDHGINSFTYKKGNRDWESLDEFKKMTLLLKSSDSRPLTIEEEKILTDIFDMDNLYRFFIGEYILSHWDGYVNNLNNFYIFYDQTLEKIFFLPWGTDQTLQGTHFRFINIKSSLLRAIKRSELFRNELNDLCDELRSKLQQEGGALSQLIEQNRDILNSILSDSEMDETDPLIDVVRYNLESRINSTDKVL